MAEYTPNLNLYKPNRDDDIPVDMSLSDNFRKIDDANGEVSSQLADIANVESYGITGGADETASILSAFSDCVSKNKILKFNKAKTYIFSGNGVINIPAIDGNGAVLECSGDPTFEVAGNSSVNDLRVHCAKVYLNSSIPSNPYFKVDGKTNVSFNNIDFSSLATPTGDKRARTAISVNSSVGVHFNNIKGHGFRAGIEVVGYCENITHDNIHFENTELLAHAKGSPTDVTGGNYIKNISFDNITHVNTKEQQQNYQIHKGADTLMLEKCDGIFIGSIYSERAVERAIYMSCCKNVVGDKVNVIDTQGVKFSGNVRYDLQIDNVAENCIFNQITARCTDFPEQNAFETYFSNNVKVNNIVQEGNNIGHCPVMASRFVKDLEINSITAHNIKRSMFEYVHWGDIEGVPELNIPPTLEADYPALIDGLAINNIRGRNTNIIGYEAIRFVNYGSAMPVGEYRHKNIFINNVYVDNQKGVYSIYNEVTGTTNTTMCTGLTNIDDVVNLRIENCTVRGFKGVKVNGSEVCVPFQIGSNSLDVTILHEENVRNTYLKKFNFGTLHVSPTSNFKLKGYDRLYNLSEVINISPHIDSTDPSSTVDLKNKFNAKSEMFVSSSGNDTILLYGFDDTLFSIPTLVGTVSLSTERGDYAKYTLDSNQISKIHIGDTAVFDISTMSGKISIYKDPNFPRYIIRERSGQLTKLNIEYSLSSQ